MSVKEGLQSLLTSPIVDTTSALSSLQYSQQTLALEITSLTEKLHRYSEASQVIDLKPVLKRLDQTSRRLNALNNTISTIETRLFVIRKELIQKRSRTRT